MNLYFSAVQVVQVVKSHVLDDLVPSRANDSCLNFAIGIPVKTKFAVLEASAVVNQIMCEEVCYIAQELVVSMPFTPKKWSVVIYGTHLFKHA